MISTALQQELRARFNPEGSLLRRQQLRMLDLLEAVDQICRKHHIPYWLSSGTLLGAIRHQGFIPWDDDLDIEMLRSDYFRLLEVLPKELPENMVLQTQETDTYYILPYAKVRDKKSYLEELCAYDRVWKYRGIYIDIFPLELVPYPFAWISRHLQGQIYNQLNNSNLTEDTIKRRILEIYKFNARVSFPLQRLFTKCLPVKAYRQSFGSCYHTPCYLKEVFPLEEAEFEGKKFFVPHDTDAMLRRRYGNYWELPNVDELHPHYSKLEIYG